MRFVRDLPPATPFAAVGVLAIATVAIGGEGQRPLLAVVATALLAALILASLAVPWARLPSWSRSLVPIGFFVFVALLRHAEGGGSSGLSPLLLLPVLWAGLYSSRHELWTYIGLIGVTLVVPILVFGQPEYPPSEWRRAILLTLMAGFVGATIHRLVAQTRQRLDAQEEAEKLKDEFFSLVSHELRTPLTSIIGYLEELLEDEDEPPSEHQRKFLGVVKRNSDRLLRLVNDLLLIVRVESGRLHIDLSTADLCDIARDSVDAARGTASASGVELRFEGPDHTVPSEVDVGRMGQVVDNLISNAIKYTPDGGVVTVTVRDSGGQALIEVNDTGIGIPDEEQAQLFGRFFRASTAVERAIPGIGLGLTIVRAMVEAHGGEVGFRSRVGEGTSFFVTLPYSDSGGV